jgi:hypothetical protein
MILEHTTKAFEDLKNPDWRSLTGTPRRWMVHDGRKLRLVPSSPATVTVGYLEAPLALALDGDIPDTRIPIPHHVHLKYAAAAFLLRMDGDNQDDERAGGFMSTFDSLILR